MPDTRAVPAAPRLRCRRGPLLPALVASTLLLLLMLLPGATRAQGASQRVAETGCVVTEALQAGGQPVKGSTGNNGWAHYRLQLPAGSGPTQLRVELLQPGRTSFGARLYVATGPVDCARRASGFAMRGTRPERCVESACEEIEWVVIPDAEGAFHIAVHGGGAEFWLHASTAPFALGQLANGAGGDECDPQAGCTQAAGEVVQEGFMAWFRAPNVLTIPEGGMSRHHFGIRSSASGHASHLMVHRVPAASTALPLVLQAAGGPDAECLNMGTYGWGLTEIFSLPSGETSATEFLLGVQVHDSGTNVTRRLRFLPCTMTSLPTVNVPVCGHNASADPLAFTLQLQGRLAAEYTADAPEAAELAQGGVPSSALPRLYAPRGEWQLFRFRPAAAVVAAAAAAASPWTDGAAVALLRVSLRLTQSGRLVPLAELRAAALGGFPLEQLGASQYQLADCRPDCTLVVPITPGADSAMVAMRVDNDDQDRSFTVDAVTMDLECGWLPTCADCAAAHGAGRSCMWSADASDPAGGYCHSAGGRVVAAPACTAPPGECHTPDSLFGEVTQSCSSCPAGCGWCGQPLGSGQHAGACVPADLASGTRWVGSFSTDDHLMAAGFCAVWDAPRDAPRTPETCDDLADAASVGACDLASADCAGCAGLMPVCTYCTDPAEPSGAGKCVPISADGSSDVCAPASGPPWLGYGSGEASCPPRGPAVSVSGTDKFTSGVTALSEGAQTATTVTVPPPVSLPPLSETSLGGSHGIASNAVYLAARVSPSAAAAGAPAVYNLRLRVAGPPGAALRAMAAVDAVPVPGGALTAGTFTWAAGQDGEAVLPVGAFLGSGLPRQVLFSLEQVLPADSTAPSSSLEAVVSLEVEPGLLSTGIAPLEGTVCCGGTQLYRLQLDAPEEGGSVAVELEGLTGAGAGGVMLLASHGRQPARTSSSYSASAGTDVAPPLLNIYIGAPGSERTERTWYIAVAAPEPADPSSPTSWADSSASFRLRAVRTLPGAVAPSPSATFAGFETDLAIWQWVLIAVSIGVLLGLALAVFYVLNRLAYKRLRRRMYEKRASMCSPAGSPRRDETSPLKAAFDAEAPASASATPGSTPGGKAGGGLLARLIGGRGKRGGGDEAGTGLLGGRKVKWYDPATFQEPAGADEGGDSAAAPVEAALTEVEDVEMVGVGPLGSTAVVTVAPAGTLMDSINSNLWRNSVAASSTSGAAEPETPTSATLTTARGDMSVLNERMAVLARAEELEEARLGKARPDSANPVRGGRASSGNSRTPARLEGQPAPLAAAALREKIAPPEPAKTAQAPHPPEPALGWATAVSSKRGVDNGAAPVPQRAPPAPAPERRLRMAPPPLSVMLGADGSEADDILMLSEEQAQTISAGGQGTKANPWREERTVARLLLADEEEAAAAATRASMQSSDVQSFAGGAQDEGPGLPEQVVPLRQQYTRSGSGTGSGDGTEGDDVMLM